MILIEAYALSYHLMQHDGMTQVDCTLVQPFDSSNVTFSASENHILYDLESQASNAVDKQCSTSPFN